VKKVGIAFLIFITVLAQEGIAQVTSSPAFPTADQPVTITYDATQGATGLVGASRVFMHAGVILDSQSGTDWQHVIGTWGSPTSPGEMTSLGSNKWSITITPRDYFAAAGLQANVPVYRIGMVFREAGPCGGFGGVSANCKEGKATGSQNIYVEIYQGGFDVGFIEPTQFPFFKNQGDVLEITGGSSQPSTLTLKINGVVKKTELNATALQYDHTVVESGIVTVELEGNNEVETKTKTFEYIVRSGTVLAPRPTGVKDGINYHADQSKVTLGLWAPTKTSLTSSVYVVGDFTNWEINPAYQMKRDGEHYWLEISGLIPKQEYAFQYLVDESLWIADPYSDKILDPNDQYIPAGTYPSLRQYPEEAIRNQDYFNRLSTFQTGQIPYDWQIENFQKPEKEELVIYELLIRDYFESSDRNYQNLIDTLSYLKRLGINAIELMPIMEFNGNESWGYNPAFMFAPDKYYGSKNKLKELVDHCHQNGIAVILDITLNHQDIPNSYLMMDYDFVNYKPTATNKWFNVDPKHPYNVFSDMNHESLYTQQYVDTVTHYWLNEFKVDGYRFDLTKGFTQNERCGGSTSNESCVGQRDDSRIAILKRMADAIWLHTPDAFIILEHFADNSEEKELAEYRSNEGKGMMLWGNLNYSYAQNSMGISASSDISWVFHGTRGWSTPHVVGYMESHDEERMMYRNLQFGSSSGSYSTRSLNTALERAKSAGAFFFTLPGPKMMWQFEELGYDISIEFNDRVGNKPVKWDYLNNPQRVKLFDTFSELIKLKDTHSVFKTSDVTIQGGTSLLKQIIFRNQPYNESPATSDEMNAVVIGNFEVTAKTIFVNFPHTGNWYHYFSGADTLNVSSSPVGILLQPGEFRLYTDVRLPIPQAELMSFVRPNTPVLLSVDENDSRITVTWNDNSSIESGYRIYRRTADDTYQIVGETAANVTAFYDDFVLKPETEYYYYVTATNAYESNASTVVSILTSDQLITSVEPGSIDLLKIHPNPTKGFLIVNMEKVNELKVYDMRGVEQSFSQQQSGIDIGNLQAGIYVLKICDKHYNWHALKIVKQ